MLKEVMSIIGTLFLAGGLAAQEVNSKAYKKVLNTLLDHSVPEISVHELREEKEIIFLDAREKNEFKVSKIAGSTWVGYDDFSLKRVKDIPKDKEIIVYCSVGYRSEKVAEKLIDAGFTNVSNLYGGIFEWKNQEKPVVNPEGNETRQVHAYDRIWGVWLKKGDKVYE